MNILVIVQTCRSFLQLFDISGPNYAQVDVFFLIIGVSSYL